MDSVPGMAATVAPALARPASNTGAPEGQPDQTNPPRFTPRRGFCVGLPLPRAERCEFRLPGLRTGRSICRRREATSRFFGSGTKKVLQPILVVPATTALRAQKATERA